jgi:hypothetical protein
MDQGFAYPHPACISDEALLKQCTVGRGRGSGPGGQNRNKVETEITITHKPTGLIGQAGERRSQNENKKVAIRRLRLLLATHHRGSPPKGGRTLDEILGPRGSDLWRSRRQGDRIVCNPGHHDYPALLAEAMDMIADSGHDPAHAAARLEITTSQLIKLVKDHPPAMQAWNATRQQRGQHPLR